MSESVIWLVLEFKKCGNYLNVHWSSFKSYIKKRARDNWYPLYEPLPHGSRTGPNPAAQWPHHQAYRSKELPMIPQLTHSIPVSCCFSAAFHEEKSILIICYHSHCHSRSSVRPLSKGTAQTISSHRRCRERGKDSDGGTHLIWLIKSDKIHPPWSEAFQAFSKTQSLRSHFQTEVAQIRFFAPVWRIWSSQIRSDTLSHVNMHKWHHHPVKLLPVNCANGPFPPFLCFYVI